MKIHPSLEVLRSGSEGQTSAERTAAKAAPSTPAPGSDRVDLSALSTQIAELESSLAAEPGFDTKRVESIKQAIVEGRLTVDTGAVADRMIAGALAMIDRHSR